MRYAVPVSGGQLSPHFGHCEHFAFYDVEEQSRKITSKETIPSPEHQPGLLPAWLAEQGATIIIAGGMGPRAVDLLQQNGIQVVLGSMEGDPEQAVLSHLSGNLNTGDNVCDHPAG
ncbi:MAG: NifB/NifX family molybdenum-iron cluster-binding protein [Dehalococcoidales bacterium]|nr:NifB/NifX family molybdenum-iron cluster-binding protein [Dehalococcoidales bacterium]